mmetsp:Transcript_42874/g.106926  ORF Transcript_42874/g.106926 Transcript_42874/m.106926 type:complete len:244 (-) Transcript_42874:338-1069(-)
MPQPERASSAAPRLTRRGKNPACPRQSALPPSAQILTKQQAQAQNPTRAPASRTLRSRSPPSATPGVPSRRLHRRLAGLLLLHQLLQVRLHLLVGEGRLRHLHDQRLDVLAVLRRAREGQPQLERLAGPRHLHHEAEPIQLHELRLLHLRQADVVHDHGDRRLRVVGVHVAHHRRRERLDRVDARVHVVSRRRVARARKAAHKVDGLELGHAIPREVAKVDPEGVRVLRAVQLLQPVRLHLLL